MFLLVLLIIGLVLFLAFMRLVLGFFGLFFGRRMFPGYYRPYRPGFFFWRPWMYRRHMGGGFYGPHHHHHHHHRGW